MTAIPTIDEVLKGHINRCVSWYLVHSYLYYICDTSVIPDSAYDALCHRLYEEYNTISHPHKTLLDREALKAGSGFNLSMDKYPTIVRIVADKVVGGDFNPERRTQE